MKFDWNKKNTTTATYAFAVMVLSIMFFNFLTNFHSINEWTYNLAKPVFPMIYGFALAYLLNPVMEYIENIVKKPKFSEKLSFKQLRGISVLLTYILTFSILTIFTIIVLPQVIESITTMASQIEDYVIYAEKVVEKIFHSIPATLIPETYVEQASDIIGQAVADAIVFIGNSVPHVVGLAVGIGTGVISTIMAVIVSCYLLASKEKFIAQTRKGFCAILPARYVSSLAEIANTTDRMFGKFIIGKIIDSIIIGILCFIGLWVLKMPNTVLVSVIVGITNVIPYFGPFIGAIPSFFLIAFISPTQGLVFIAFIIVLQQLDGNVIGPLILGDSTGLSPFWVIFAILLFGGAFGVFGMFIGVPTFGVIYWLVKTRVSVLLQRKDMSDNTDDYMSSVDEIYERNKKDKSI